MLNGVGKCVQKIDEKWKIVDSPAKQKTGENRKWQMENRENHVDNVAE